MGRGEADSKQQHPLRENRRKGGVKRRGGRSPSKTFRVALFRAQHLHAFSLVSEGFAADARDATYFRIYSSLGDFLCADLLVRRMPPAS